MNLVIDFAPDLEARLNEEAKSQGLAPGDLVKKLIAERLPLCNTAQERSIHGETKQDQNPADGSGLDGLRRDIAIGLAQARAGQLLDGEQVFDEIEEEGE